jgi:DnaJ domain
MKNYYSVLGVLPSAELVVIKAAYRALCQMYHPDKYEGDKSHGEALLKEFNEAWSVLSDHEKRRAFDAQFAEGLGTFGESPIEHSTAASFRKALLEAFPELETVTDYYADLWDIIEGLQHVSRQLASGFVAALLETKAFRERAELAETLSDIFFCSYFGKNEAILGFAKLVVGIGAKDAALELNKVVNTFGDGIEPSLIIPRIDQKYKISALAASRKAADIATKQERCEAERQRKHQHEIKLAIREVKFLQSRFANYKLDELLVATRPIRQALDMSMTFEKSGKGLYPLLARTSSCSGGMLSTGKFDSSGENSANGSMEH